MSSLYAFAFQRFKLKQRMKPSTFHWFLGNCAPALDFKRYFVFLPVSQANLAVLGAHGTLLADNSASSSMKHHRRVQ
jgi:hypothetical protein